MLGDVNPSANHITPSCAVVPFAVGYDTPERVADVFGRTNATPLASAANGIRQAGVGGLANLQQVLANSGFRFQTANADDKDEDMSDSDDSNTAEGEGGSRIMSREDALKELMRAMGQSPAVPDKVVVSSGVGWSQWYKTILLELIWIQLFSRLLVFHRTRPILDPYQPRHHPLPTPSRHRLSNPSVPLPSPRIPC